MDDPGKSEKRALILKMAVQEFAARGYDGASTASIARLAGVTQPLVHYHFDSKKNLWKQAVTHAFTEFSTLEEAFAKDESVRDDPHAQIAKIIRGLTIRMGRFPGLGRMLLFESGSGTEREQWLIETYVRPYHSLLGRVIEEAQRNGQLRREFSPAHIIFAINGATSLIFQTPSFAKQVWNLDVTSRETIETHVECVIEMVLNGLFPAQDPTSVPS